VLDEQEWKNYRGDLRWPDIDMESSLKKPQPPYSKCELVGAIRLGKGVFAKGRPNKGDGGEKGLHPGVVG